MKKRNVETAVGVFVLIGLLCVGYLTIKLGQMTWMGGGRYSVYALFESASGLKEGAYVEIAGVQVGQVDAISLDNRTQLAKIRLSIDENVELTDDVIASVKTSGLIGDKYIKLSPGGSDLILQDGDLITDTESAVDIEELVSKYAFGDVTK